MQQTTQTMWKAIESVSLSYSYQYLTPNQNSLKNETNLFNISVSMYDQSSLPMTFNFSNQQQVTIQSSDFQGCLTVIQGTFRVNPIQSTDNNQGDYICLQIYKTCDIVDRQIIYIKPAIQQIVEGKYVLELEEGDSYQISCEMWDENLQQWDSSKCSTLQEFYTATCECDQLGLVRINKIYQHLKADKNGGGDDGEVAEIVAPIVIILFVLLIIIVCLIIYKRNKIKKRMQKEKEKSQSGNSENQQDLNRRKNQNILKASLKNEQFVQEIKFTEEENKSSDRKDFNLNYVTKGTDTPSSLRENQKISSYQQNLKEQEDSSKDLILSQNYEKKEEKSDQDQFLYSQPTQSGRNINQEIIKGESQEIQWESEQNLFTKTVAGKQHNKQQTSNEYDVIDIQLLNKSQEKKQKSEQSMQQEDFNQEIDNYHSNQEFSTENQIIKDKNIKNDFYSTQNEKVDFDFKENKKEQRNEQPKIIGFQQNQTLIKQNYQQVVQPQELPSIQNYNVEIQQIKESSQESSSESEEEWQQEKSDQQELSNQQFSENSQQVPLSQNMESQEEFEEGSQKEHSFQFIQEANKKPEQIQQQIVQQVAKQEINQEYLFDFFNQPQQQNKLINPTQFQIQKPQNLFFDDSQQQLKEKNSNQQEQNKEKKEVNQEQFFDFNFDNYEDQKGNKQQEKKEDQENQQEVFFSMFNQNKQDKKNEEQKQDIYQIEIEAPQQISKKSNEDKIQKNQNQEDLQNKPEVFFDFSYDKQTSKKEINAQENEGNQQSQQEKFVEMFEQNKQDQKNEKQKEEVQDIEIETPVQTIQENKEDLGSENNWQQDFQNNEQLFDSFEEQQKQSPQKEEIQEISQQVQLDKVQTKEPNFTKEKQTEEAQQLDFNFQLDFQQGASKNQQKDQKQKEKKIQSSGFEFDFDFDFEKKEPQQNDQKEFQAEEKIEDIQKTNPSLPQKIEPEKKQDSMQINIMKIPEPQYFKQQVPLKDTFNFDFMDSVDQSQEFLKKPQQEQEEKKPAEKEQKLMQTQNNQEENLSANQKKVEESSNSFDNEQQNIYIDAEQAFQS